MDFIAVWAGEYSVTVIVETCDNGAGLFVDTCNDTVLALARPVSFFVIFLASLSFSFSWSKVVHDSTSLQRGGGENVRFRVCCSMKLRFHEGYPSCSVFSRLSERFSSGCRGKPEAAHEKIERSSVKN